MTNEEYQALYDEYHSTDSISKREEIEEKIGKAALELFTCVRGQRRSEPAAPSAWSSRMLMRSAQCAASIFGVACPEPHQVFSGLNIYSSDCTGLSCGTWGL